jgi:hypothetical protein
MLLPIIRIADVKVARSERILLLVLLAEAILFQTILYEPTEFTQYDEMLHWISANDIVYRHKLFLDNPMMTIAPYYPALEIVTTTLANLANMTVVSAGHLELMVIRPTLIVGLFLFFEKLSGSSRLAAIAAIVYMCAATFPVFEAGWAYESLGLPLCILIGLAELQINRVAYSVRALILPGMLLATLALTHHVSAFWMAGYLIALMIIEMFRRKDRARVFHLLLIGVVMLGVSFPIVWMTTKGNPLVNYLGPTVEEASNSFYLKISGQSPPRPLFVSGDGEAQPITIQVTAIASTLLITMGLATGFFRSLCLSLSIGTRIAGWPRLLWVMRREWLDSRVILLTLAAFGFPLSVALRVSSAAWEIGHRMSTFVFIGAAFVVAVSIVHFWQARPNRWNRIAINAALVLMVLGNVMLGWGYLAIHTPYKVGADPGSIESMGIGTAEWTKDWLGPGKRFSADRVNKTLLATYGDQNIIPVMISSAIFNKEINGDALYPIREGKIDYLLVDLRLTTTLPVLGEYYEKWEHSGGRPPSPKLMLKFDREPNVGRIYDNGFIVIYDVRRLHD